jgi:hypothetical protein
MTSLTFVGFLMTEYDTTDYVDLRLVHPVVLENEHVSLETGSFQLLVKSWRVLLHLASTEGSILSQVQY